MSLDRIDFGSSPNTPTGDTGGAAITKLDNNMDRLESFGFKRVREYGWDSVWGTMTALQDSHYGKLQEVKYIFKHPFSVNSSNDFAQSKFITPTKKASMIFGLSAASGNVDLVVKVQQKSFVTVTSGTLAIDATMTRNIPNRFRKFKPYIFVDKGTGKGRMKIEAELINPTTLATVWSTIEIHDLDDGESVRSVQHWLPRPSTFIANGRGGMLYGYRYRITALDVALDHDNYGAGEDGTLTMISETINPSTDLVNGQYRVEIDEVEPFNYVEVEVNYNAVDVTVNKSILKCQL